LSLVAATVGHLPALALVGVVGGVLIEGFAAPEGRRRRRFLPCLGPGHLPAPALVGIVDGVRFKGVNAPFACLPCRGVALSPYCPLARPWDFPRGRRSDRRKQGANQWDGRQEVP